VLFLALVASPLCAQISRSAGVDEVSGSRLQLVPPLESSSSSLASDDPSEGSVVAAPAQSPQPAKLKLPDFNRDIYYKNKLEFSVESGYLPINIPLIYDFLVDSPYTDHPSQPYTMIPNILSIRWQHREAKGHTFLRGNWDYTFSGSYTDVERGPETRYLAFDYGIRRNFIQPRWRVAPYFEMRGGVGNINAKGPLGVLYAQGQDLTFTYMCGSGFRYNFNPKYSITAGVNYMHVSNFYLSDRANVEDYGINVYGPMFGFNVRLGKPKPPVAQ
jgi:hypothetical protein